MEIVIEKNEIEKHDFKPSSEFAPYILMIALSLHGCFEGIALGIQKIPSGTIVISMAILAHKWAEAFSLVIFSLKIREFLSINQELKKTEY